MDGIKLLIHLHSVEDENKKTSSNMKKLKLDETLLKQPYLDLGATVTDKQHARMIPY